ncbi:MAG: hypothetical protein AVDCRST_MAG30-3651, partial [uncultured Solirubrobacteraceae bacterium]
GPDTDARDRRRPADQHPLLRLERHGRALQGVLRARPDEGADLMGRPGHARLRARGHALARRAQPREDERAPAAPGHADVLPVRHGQGVLHTGRAVHGAQGARVHQRHRHGGGRARHRAVRPAPRGLRRPLAHGRRRGAGL